MQQVAVTLNCNSLPLAQKMKNKEGYINTNLETLDTTNNTWLRKNHQKKELFAVRLLNI